jgi:hypothetical protein
METVVCSFVDVSCVLYGLEHLELLRNNEAYLNALGAQRIPDPTTAGDFCRRFSELSIHVLIEALVQKADKELVRSNRR